MATSGEAVIGAPPLSARTAADLDSGENRPILPPRISPYSASLSFLLFDVFTILASGIAPIAWHIGLETPAGMDHLKVVLAGLPLYLGFAWSLRAYAPGKVLAPKQVAWRTVAALLLTFTVVLLIAASTKTTGLFSRVWFFSWVASLILLVALHRATTLAYLENKLAQGACLTRALLVSVGPLGLDPERLAIQTRNRTRALGHLRASAVEDLQEVLRLARPYQPDAVIIEVPWHDFPAAGRLACEVLQDLAVDISIVPVVRGPHSEILQLRRLGSRLAFDISHQPLSQWSGAIKRSEDVLLATIALVALAPVMVLIASAIKLESRGPVLFRQLRAGFNGTEIEVFKFRSMYADKTDDHAVRQTAKGDERVTRVGRFIRRTSLDELPQFINVLQGSMSVVGPRPHALATRAGGHPLERAALRYPARHRVKPGITGWAQVNGLRGELDTVEKLRRRVAYDLEYIERWSVWLDLKIVVMTLLRFAFDPKAY